MGEGAEVALVQRTSKGRSQEYDLEWEECPVRSQEIPGQKLWQEEW